MRLLLLGGTRFVGRHLAETALARGHQVTLFHRGKTNPGLFPQAEHLLGDRESDLSILSGRRWDAVLDVNGYVPRIVRASAERLAGAADRYVFISTISVYAEDTVPGRHEGSPRFTWMSEEFLLERVEPYRELPLWISGPEHEGVHRLDNRKAVAAGLTFRPLADTVRATLDWLTELGGDIPPLPGADRPAHLTPEREAELLRAWRSPVRGETRYLTPISFITPCAPSP